MFKDISLSLPQVNQFYGLSIYTEWNLLMFGHV